MIDVSKSSLIALVCATPCSSNFESSRTEPLGRTASSRMKMAFFGRILSKRVCVFLFTLSLILNPSNISAYEEDFIIT